MRYYPRNDRTRIDAVRNHLNQHSERNDQSRRDQLARYAYGGQAAVVAGGTLEAGGAEATVVAGLTAATGTLTLTPGAIADDVIEIGGVYYQFAADPTAGTPDGSVGTPYLVDVGVSDTASLDNLLKAINATGTPGTTYSAEITTAHATVEATASDATTLDVEARTPGAAGNAITTTQSGDDGLAWGAVVLEGGLDALVLALTLTGEDMWVKDVLSKASLLTALPETDGLRAAVEASHWVRTSDTVLTLTLPAIAAYSIAEDTAYDVTLAVDLFVSRAEPLVVTGAINVVATV